MNEQNISLRSKWPFDLVLQNDTWSQWIFTIPQFAIVFFSALPNYLYFHMITIHGMPLEPFLPIVDFFYMSVRLCSLLAGAPFATHETILSQHFISRTTRLCIYNEKLLSAETISTSFKFQWRLQWKMSQVQIVFHTHHDIRSLKLNQEA